MSVCQSHLSIYLCDMMSVYNLVILAILDVGFRLFAQLLRKMLHFIMLCVLEYIGLPGFLDKIRRKIILLFPSFG